MKKKFRKFKEKYLTLNTLKVAVNLIYVIVSLGIFTIPIHYYFKMLMQSGLFLIYLLVTGIIRSVEEEKDALPTVKNRFTRKAENGSIIIEEKRFREAILYLYEIEDKLYK